MCFLLENKNIIEAGRQGASCAEWVPRQAATCCCVWIPNTSTLEICGWSSTRKLTFFGLR